MKRDMELVAKLLLAIENTQAGEIGLEFPPGYERAEVIGHLFVIWDAGLIEAMDGSSSSGPDITVIRLTWIGHEFLDSIRKGDLWEELSSRLKEAPFEVVKEIASALAKKKLGLN